MRIALVVPPIRLRTDESLATPLLGLLYLAANLPNRHNVQIYDFYADSCPESVCVSKVSQYEPDIVGLTTVFSAMYEPALRLARKLKTNCPRCQIVLGGNHATFLAREALQQECIDFVVLHEGEHAFRSLVDHLDSRCGFPAYNTLSRRHLQLNIRLASDLDGYAYPSAALSKIHCWNRVKYDVTVIASRGCIYTCPYCSTSAMALHHHRRRSIENIKDEISQLRYLQNWSSKISFMDDFFTYDKRWLVEMCDMLHAEKIKWGCSARIDSVDADLLAAMREAGCENIFFGVESGSNRILHSIGRRYTAEDVLRVFRDCEAIGIVPCASFILGLPGETEADIRASLTLAQAIPTSDIRVGTLEVYPGTSIWANPDQFGMLSFTRDFEGMCCDNRPKAENGCVKAERLAELAYEARLLVNTKRGNS